MASFTTRVELHETESGGKPDYNKLHEAMQKEKFTRTITSDKGIEYQLPTSEYNKVGTYSKSDVLESARRAATTTGHPFSILVTEFTGATWANLQTVKK